MSERQPRTRAEARSRQAGRDRQNGDEPSARRVWVTRGLWAAFGAFVLGILGFFTAYALTDVPQPNEMVQAQASVVYYSDGTSELARLSDDGGNRESVPLAEISEDMQHAILAAEDRDFYENSGISPTGIARAVWVAVKGGQATQGGSTITQQYVKNYFLTQDRTLTRKAKEILISLKIDKQQDKDQILENYLNTIYYGRGAYGIQTAAQTYFGVDAKDLDPSQSALLASVIRGPSLYDPQLGEEQQANAESRSGYILDAMVDQGWLSADQRAEAAFPEVKEYKPKALGGTNGYIVDLVKRELVDKHQLSESDIQRGGLRIVSTIEKPKQAAAVAAVEDERPEKQDDIHEGLVSIKPGDGAVVALYGGRDFADRALNDASQAKMQAGSTFKIFALIAALQSRDVSTQTRFNGASPQYFDQFADSAGSTDAARRGRVKNFGNEGFGNIDLLKATKNSVNTVYAQLNIEAGPEKTMKAAEDAGVRSELQPNVANVLGTDSVTVMDMATAYATIAAEGLRAEPYLVQQIAFLDDRLPTIEAEPQTKQVFDKDLMSDVIEAMEQPVNGGTARYVGENLGRPAAGKTGTSESFRSAWFDGYVPQLATAVGMYRSDPDTGDELEMENLPTAGDITGGSFPARIWTAYMKKALEGTEVVPFPKPAHINRDAAPPPPPAPTQAPEPTKAPPSSSSAPTTSAPPTTSEPPEPTKTVVPSPSVSRTRTTAPPTPSPTPTSTAGAPVLGTG
ncbi:penicillin-binding protein [Phycicoccus sp. CSK15P-2]|uniref:transglycosylase domain-containing protein n=1 Tax=Phycicoccus sp. CSK15P-2 TaxID=2807627 RepID=UPI00194E0894|nr:transglycosylase domain-containing protein [Phycicoccus sp. CSK15P-2]MBM6403538.1 penicillin-binding protein [Phycicoccus sp. CSK15P-2]